jgi:hypothetical protein
MRPSIAWILVATLAAFAPACGGNGLGGDDDGGTGDGDGGDDEFSDAMSPEVCKHVDVLFSVDPSGSMVTELAAMSGDVFPDFAAALINVGDQLETYRVGVIDSCPDPANLHTRGESTGECNFQGGNVWMEHSSTALNDEFECVGDIYKESNCSGANDDEQPASAACTALSDPWISNENAGFVRDDALLVIVAITDEDEQPVPDATAEEVFNCLVAIKGDVRRIVFLGIGGGPPDGCIDPEGPYGKAEYAEKLLAITEMFMAEDRGVWWDLCEGQLGDGLAEAMAVIDTACDDFPPIL